MKFETVLYAFAMLLLVLISLPDGNDSSQQDNKLAPNHQEQGGSINVAIAQAPEMVEFIPAEETSETEVPREDH